MTYVISFLVGVLAGAAVPIAALRFYVNVGNPYLLLAGTFAMLAIVLTLWRNRRAMRPSLRANLLALSLEGAVFAIGAFGALHALLAIYPPNFG